MSSYDVAPCDLSPLLAYQLYVSIKLDFSQQKYDYHRDLLITKCNQESFNNRNDKYFFIKIADKFLYQSRYIPLLASNFYTNPKTHVKDLMTKSCLENAVYFRKYMNNFYGSFETDIQRLKYNHDVDLIEKLYHPIHSTNYFSLLGKDVVHPITCSILNLLYFDMIKDTDWMIPNYNDKSFYLSKLINYATPIYDEKQLRFIVEKTIND